MRALERRALRAVDRACGIDRRGSGVAGSSPTAALDGGREGLQDLGPDALDEVLEGGGGGADDGDVELDGGPDAEERGVPGYVWVDGHGVDVDEAEEGDEAGAVGAEG